LTYQSRNFFFHRDFPTLVDQMKSFDSRLKAEAIIIIAESDEFIFGDRLAPPLQEIFGHNVATIRRDGPRLEPFLKRLLATAKIQNRPVQLIATEPIVPGVRNLLTLKPVGIFPLTLITLQNTFFEYPSRKETVVYPIQIYDVTSITSNALAFFTDQMIDIGDYDAPFIREGFYGKENIPNFPSSRWVSGEAMMDIPIYRKEGRQLFIRAMTFRPPNSTRNSVQVYLDGKFLGNFVPQQDWKVFSFNTNIFPKHTVSSLQFKTAPFTPAELKIGNDSRKLGFLLDWIKIQ